MGKREFLNIGFCISQVFILHISQHHREKKIEIDRERERKKSQKGKTREWENKSGSGGERKRTSLIQRLISILQLKRGLWRGRIALWVPSRFCSQTELGLSFSPRSHRSVSPQPCDPLDIKIKIIASASPFNFDHPCYFVNGCPVNECLPDAYPGVEEDLLKFRRFIN